MQLREMDLHVLLVDDDAALSEMLTEYLVGEGIRTTAAFNGPDGAAAALSGQFDVVILDVMLPGMDGNEVLRHIRRTSEIPGGFDDRGRGKKCGVRAMAIGRANRSHGHRDLFDRPSDLRSNRPTSPSKRTPLL